MVKLSRLFVFAFAVFVPIYILTVFIAYDFQLLWLPESWLGSPFLHFVVTWVCPVLFCISWGYFMLKMATRISNTIVLMGKESSFISPHYFIFFGLNTIVILIIFLIPLITPVVSMLVLGSLVFNLLTSRVPWEDLDKKTRKFVVIVTAIGAVPGLFCGFLSLPESWALASGILMEYWSITYIPLFYTIKALGVALSIGGVVMLFRKSRAHKKHQHLDERLLANPDMFVLEAAIVALFLFLNYQIGGAEIVDLLYWIGPIFIVVGFIVDLFKGKQKQDGKRLQNPLGIIVWGIFIGSIFLIDRYSYNDMGVLGLVIVCGIIFSLYFIAFMNHPGHETLENQ